MSFSIEKEDDDDFFPNPNYKSNLTTMFKNREVDHGNTSLTYTAPRQPNTQVKKTSSTGPKFSIVLIAKPVQTFKMVGSEYEFLGRMGASVVSVTEEKHSSYLLIIYKDKKTHVCVNSIHRDFMFTILSKNYALFYDKNNVKWSILFNSAIDMVDFSLQVALARWRVGDPATPIFTQNLWCPEEDSPKAVVGDAVELTYTIHSLTSAEGMAESMTMWVEVEEKGWKQVLQGVQATTKRVVIMHPYLLGDLNPEGFEFSSTVVVKLTVVQVSKPQLTTAQSEPTLSLPAIDTTTATTTTTTSTTTTDTTQSSSKAELISRMARMGQPLPFHTTVPPNIFPDKSEEDVAGRNCSTPPKLYAKHQSTSVAEPLTTTPAVASSAPPALQQDHSYKMVTSEKEITNADLIAAVLKIQSNQQQQLEAQSTLQKMFSDSQSALQQQLSDFQSLMQQQYMDFQTALQQKFSDFQTTSTSLQESKVVSRILESAGTQTVKGSPTSPVDPAPCQNCNQLEQAIVLLNGKNTNFEEKFKKIKVENERLEATSATQKEALCRLVESVGSQTVEDSPTSPVDPAPCQKCNQLEQTQVLLNETIKTLERKVKTLREEIGLLESTSAMQKEALQNERIANQYQIRQVEERLVDHLKTMMSRVYSCVKVQFEPDTEYQTNFILEILKEIMKTMTLEYAKQLELSQEQPGKPLRESTAVVVNKVAEVDKEYGIEGEPGGSVIEEVQLSIGGGTKIYQQAMTNPEDASVIVQNSENHFNLDRSSTSVTTVVEATPPSNSISGSPPEVCLPQPPPPPLDFGGKDELQ